MSCFLAKRSNVATAAIPQTAHSMAGSPRIGGELTAQRPITWDRLVRRHHAENHVLPGRTIFLIASSSMVRPIPGRSGTVM